MLIEKVYITADTDEESIFYDSICLNWHTEFFSVNPSILLWLIILTIRKSISFVLS